MSRLLAALFLALHGVVVAHQGFTPASLEAASSSSSSSSSHAAMIVHVVDYAAVSNTEVARSEQEATRIWSNIDVSLSWSIGETSGPRSRATTSANARRALDVSVLLLDQDMAQRMINQEQRGPGVLARAVPEASRVYVFYDRVRIESERYPDQRGVILGRVVAHELAHLLLGHTHSNTGLFRAVPDLGSAREAFSREDAEKIRVGIAGLLSTKN